MTVANKPNSSKTIVFMSTEFFCSVSNDLREKEEVIAQYFNVPQEFKSGFRHSLNHAFVHFFLDNSLRDKRITKEMVIKAFSTSTLLPRYLKALNISMDKVFGAIENPNLYSFGKRNNYSEVFAIVKRLYENGYNLILRDDMPESVLTEALQQMNLLQYFKSVQGLIENYLTFSVKSMEELIGLNNPIDFLVVTSGEGKTSIIDAARKLGIPVMICKQFNITELNKLW